VEGAVSTELCERAREVAARLAWRHDGKSWTVDDVHAASMLLIDLADALEAVSRKAQPATTAAAAATEE
jgi:hypothetical protein